MQYQNMSVKFQIYTRFHILDGKIGTRGKYTSGLIFLIEEQIPATSQVSVTCRAFDFGQKNSYLQPTARLDMSSNYKTGYWSKVQFRQDILGRKTSICNHKTNQSHVNTTKLYILIRKIGNYTWPGLVYMLSFIFWLRK